MNKTEFVALISARTGCTKKHTEEMLNAVLDGIGDVLQQGERVHFVGFGSFDTKLRPSRTIKMPATEQLVELPAGRSVVFRPGKNLKEKIEP
ncbi:MAG: HU family DNA-binding protein [Butyricicoccus sp.]